MFQQTKFYNLRAFPLNLISFLLFFFCRRLDIGRVTHLPKTFPVLALEVSHPGNPLNLGQTKTVSHHLGLSLIQKKHLWGNCFPAPFWRWSHLVVKSVGSRHMARVPALALALHPCQTQGKSLDLSVPR